MTAEPLVPPSNPRVDAERIRDALRLVIDPELGMNIVALGLVYRVDVAADRVVVEMTMTSPACPMGEQVLGEVRAALAKILPDTMQTDVRLVWEPRWNPAMMDQGAKRHFGWAPD